MFDEDFGNICRLCLRQEDEMFPIFEKIDKESGNGDLSERITLIAPIQVTPDDGLPTLICSSCQEQVNKFHDFRILIEVSDRTLRGCITATVPDAQETKIKEEPEESDYVKNDLDCDLLSTNTILVSTESGIQVWKICNSDADEKLHAQSVCKKQKDEEKRNNTPGLQCIVKNKGCNTLEKQQDETEDFKLTENISCQLCSEVFQCLSDLKVHISEHFLASRNKTTKANCCTAREEFCGILKDTFENSDSADLETISLVCVQCKSTFSTKEEYIVHTSKHLSSKPYKCKFCNKAFVRIACCKCHERCHLEEKKYTCTECDRTFLKRSELRYHLGSHSKTPPVCTSCNKYFQNVQSFKIHMKRHTLGSRFICETCGKSYYTNSELARHVQMHSGKREHPCQLCEMSFFSRPELNRHLKYHTGEKKFQCKICCKSYFESGHLKVHERIHTGEKPFVCGVCEKSFVSRSKLVRHRKVHDNEQSR